MREGRAHCGEAGLRASGGCAWLPVRSAQLRSECARRLGGAARRSVGGLRGRDAARRWGGGDCGCADVRVARGDGLRRLRVAGARGLDGRIRPRLGRAKRQNQSTISQVAGCTWRNDASGNEDRRLVVALAGFISHPDAGKRQDHRGNLHPAAGIWQVPRVVLTFDTGGLTNKGII